VVFKIDFLMQFPDIFFSMEWGEMDAVLQHPTFSELKKVEICYLVCLAGVGVEEPESNEPKTVLDLMPQCRARGIVCVREVDDDVREISLIL
jgi:hypothetical protein